MAKPPILYLSYDGLTDQLGQSQVLPYILGLCEMGYSFHIVSFEKPEKYRENRDTIHQIIYDRPIVWHPLIYHKKPPLLSTLFDLIRMQRKALWLVKSQNIGLIHCRSYLAGLTGLKLKRKLNVKFLFDIRGFWADERIDGGIWSITHPVYRRVYNYFKKQEIRMMQEADHIISLTQAGQKEIVSGNLFRGKVAGIPADKITVIPCAVDLKLFDPTKISAEDRDVLRESLGLERARHILVYLGSIGTWYLLKEMLLYFKQFAKESPGSYFLFVTKDDPIVIWSKVKELGLESSQIIISSASRKEVPLYLSIASLGIFFIKPSYSKKASSATKMGEMLAMGLPIITNDIGDIRYIKNPQISIVDFETLKIDKDTTTGENIGLEYFELANGVASYEIVYSNLLK
ncbi:MAG: glycosyltransferase involved in cell wall biosynthesis [Cyclobacteriaceae bacterium]